MNPNEQSPAQILRKLAQVLREENCEPDDLIHAFGKVEEQRVEIAELLTSFLERQSE